MSKELKDILSNLNKDIEQEKLLAYLNNELNEEQQHEVEDVLNDDPFASDALEGLQAMGNKKDLTPMIHQLNKDLKTKLSKKKLRSRPKMPEQNWLYITIITLLVIVVIAYVVVKKMHAG